MQPTKLLVLATFAAVAAGMLLVASCTFKPRELTRYAVEFTPQQVCDGEPLIVSYWAEGQERIDWVELQARDGTTLLRLEPPDTLGVVHAFRTEWLPLKVRLQIGGDRRTYEVVDVTSIDEPAWVTYDSVNELRGDVEHVLVGTVLEWDTELGDRVDVNLYEVYAEFFGFEWDPPSSEFGARAHLVAVRNAGGRPLTFSLPRDQEALLLPAGELELVEPLRPWQGFRATFEEPQRILIGLQKGEITKPENEHFEYTDLYVERKYPAGLEVVCMDALPIG